MRLISYSGVRRLLNMALLPAAFVAAASLLLLGLSASRSPVSTASSPAVLKATTNAPPATRDIVPASVVYKDALVFIGTGDGNEGSWRR